MPLSKVIIADDDYLVIEDLKRSIAWEELGYVVAGTATNGLDALHLVRKVQPDLLITDIIMPSMTGLELIEEVRKLYPDMQILIISSYDEFEYAKSAIAHGVADYLLKTQITPMSFSQRLIELSGSATANRRRNQAALRQSLQDYFYHHTVARPMDPVLQTISPFKYCFIVIGVHTPFSPNQETSDRIAYENIIHADEIIASKFTEIGIPIRFVFGSLLILGFVSTQDPQQSQSTMRSIALKLRSLLDTSIARSANIFVCDSPCTLQQFRESYFRQLPIIQFHTVFCENVTLTWHELETQTYTPSERDYSFGNLPSSAKAISDTADRLNTFLLQRTECADIASLQRTYHMLIVWLQANSSSDSQLLNDSHYFPRPHMFFEHVKALMLSAGEPGESSAMPIVVEKAMQYIRDNFADHSISVQNISDAVNVSPSRLGVLFRQSLGKSINEALTDTRIAHAVYLLENTSLKIYEVADRSGFNAPHYFSDIMYKKTGKRPIDYKRLPTQE